MMPAADSGLDEIVVEGAAQLLSVRRRSEHPTRRRLQRCRASAVPSWEVYTAWGRVDAVAADGRSLALRSTFCTRILRRLSRSSRMAMVVDQTRELLVVQIPAILRTSLKGRGAVEALMRRDVTCLV